MRIYVRNNPAKLHPDPICNDGALGIFKRGHPTRTRRTIWVAIWDQFLIWTVVLLVIVVVRLAYRLHCMFFQRRGNDFSARGAKIERPFGWGSKKLVEKSRQSNSKYNVFVYFSKKVYTVHNGGWGKAPEDGGIFENFCVKSNLTVFLSPVSYRKNWGAGCTSCSPNNFIGGATAPLPPPVRSLIISAGTRGGSPAPPTKLLGEQLVHMCFSCPSSDSFQALKNFRFPTDFAGRRYNSDAAIIPHSLWRLFILIWVLMFVNFPVNNFCPVVTEYSEEFCANKAYANEWVAILADHTAAMQYSWLLAWYCCLSVCLWRCVLWRSG